MKFTSQKLQQSFDAAKPILEKIIETKNFVSAEIKNLEKYFQSLNINESISYLATNPNNTGNICFDQFSEHSGSGIGISTEELIIWDDNKKRIMYVLNEYEASVDFVSAEIGNHPPVDLNMDSRKTIVEKPLIETTFEIRKQIYENHLSDFLTHVAKKFEVNLSVSDEDIDIPF